MSRKSHVGLIEKIVVRGRTRKLEHRTPYMVLETGLSITEVSE